MLLEDVIKVASGTGVSKITEEDVKYVFRFIDSLNFYFSIPLRLL